ncbi:MAG: hypothetical protein A3K05_00045 [Candidatus Doudnabacteria bacterium RIFCSPHIGHO2_01_48_18]|nr:MAG: hypothetical protein A3K05_00045 [Candidatus Doudnabacteria bacterium RIFCSPHIGHO2_01_48_18]OGE91828.1 MAG: hypothetical protein A3F44_00530 [Candidatus Doudnabacteria bacterium RIFCSPHIGHO2_12_FULL_47_25]OGF02231.1 MAG: hypothetical protein A3G07_03115 [Candidatus Doudnabacteria bacterium RIFCSPLOWO2_12_FULL_47_12]
MLKFVHKHHYKKSDHPGKIIITYSLSEIVMGGLLIIMLTFYIYNYLSTNLNPPVASRVYYNPPIPEPAKIPGLLEQ